MRAHGLALRAIPALLLGAVALASAPAHAEPKKEPPIDPALYNDPSYDPAAHGGVPYAVYLKMSRGTFRRSTGMMATGIVLVGLGSTAMASGTGVYASQGDCAPSIDGTAGCATHSNRTTGMAVLITGAIVTALGIPLWIIGQSEVPWMEAAKSEIPHAPRAARLVPTIVPATAGEGVALRFSF